MPVRFPFFVYVLVDPTDGEIRYVGSSGNLRLRFKQHLNDALSDWPIYPRKEWIRNLLHEGREPILEPIAYCWLEAELRQLELDWIRRLRMAGCPLFNRHVPRKFVAAPKVNMKMNRFQVFV